MKELASNIAVKDQKLPADQSVHLVVGSGVFNDPNLMEQIFSTLKPGGFLLTREQNNVEPPLNAVDVSLDVTLEQERLVLVRKV